MRILLRSGQVHAQLSRFFVVGVFAVVIDFLVYRLLLLAAIGLSPAKGMSFCTGAVFSYFANERFTFRTRGNRLAFSRFWAVYLVSLAVNVSVNAVAVALLAGVPFAITLAFLVATGVTASLNFVGMKFLVFRS